MWSTGFWEPSPGKAEWYEPFHRNKHPYGHAVENGGTMYYPYMLYNDTIRHEPVFKLQGDPYVIDLSYKNTVLESIDIKNQRKFQAFLEEKMTPGFSWGFSGYLERRDTILCNYPQMRREKRYYHLGVDIIVPLGTDLHAPLDAEVADSGYEEGEGNYGSFVLLKHEGNFRTFYSFYGHLNRESLPLRNTLLKAGDPFAKIGDFHENGFWFHHTHLQIITQQGLDRGYALKGYCSEKDLGEINDLCPSPIPLFRR
jgi:hypothetical protein